MPDLKAKMKLGLVAVAVVILAALVIAFLQFKRAQERQALTLPDIATDAILALARVRQIATRDGRLQWELDAESAQLEEGTQHLRLKSPTIVFYSEDGGRVELTAATGLLNTHNKNMVVDGAVRLNNQDYTLWTESLAYRHAERVLESAGPVKIRGRTMRLQADAMTYDIETNRARFNGRVEGEIKDGPPI